MPLNLSNPNKNISNCNNQQTFCNLSSSQPTNLIKNGQDEKELSIPESIFDCEFSPDDFENVLNAFDDKPIETGNIQGEREFSIPELIFSNNFCPNDFEKVLSAFDDQPSDFVNSEQVQFESSVQVQQEANNAVINSIPAIQDDSIQNVSRVQEGTTRSQNFQEHAELSHAYSHNAISIPQLSHRIFSWSAFDVGLKNFKFSFTFTRSKTSTLHNGSDNFENIFAFKYAVNAFNFFTKNETISIEEFDSKAIKTVSVIFSIATSLNAYSQPYYYEFWNSEAFLCYMRNCSRVPLYFFFTSLSYLMQADRNSKELLQPLIKDAFHRLLSSRILISDRWNFLHAYLEENFDITDTVPRQRSDTVRFDFSTVSFIYNVMRNSKNEKVKEFLHQVWKACKFRSHRILSVELNKTLSLFVPDRNEYHPSTFEQAARRLYQFKFTELLFKQSNSIEELFAEFEQLKLDFESVVTDFRLRTFNRKDFEKLLDALAWIQLQLSTHSFNNVLIARKFFVELECFITFKCFIFTYDFCNESQDGFLFAKTFENIKSIYKSFEEICKLLSSKRIELPVLDYTGIQQSMTENFFSLRELVGKFRFFATADSIQFVIIDDISLYLKNFEYFARNLGDLQNLSRFQYASFIVELDEILSVNGNNDERIDEIISKRKYKIFRDFWLFNPNIRLPCQLKIKRNFWSISNSF